MTQPETAVAPTSRFAHAVGHVAASRTYDIERGHIARFADALDDPNPIYRDDAAAQAAGHPTVIAPPTFAIALRAPDPRQSAGLAIDWKKLLHAEQAITSARPLYAGDRITVVATLESATVKVGKTGAMDLLTVRTEGRDADGATVFTLRSTAAIRQ